MDETQRTFLIAQSPSSLPQAPVQAQKEFDPTVTAALITAIVSFVTVVITLRSQLKSDKRSQGLEKQLEGERRQHEVALEHLKAENEERLEQLRVQLPMRRAFIDYWRKKLYEESFTYKDVFKEKTYERSLVPLLLPEARESMQKEVDNAEKEIQELTDTLKWK